MTRRAALATALACSVGAPLTAAAPADAGMQTLRSSCARQDAADGTLANGVRLPIVFCDDGVPHAGGTTPNTGAVDALPVPERYNGYAGLPRKAPPDPGSGADSAGYLGLDADVTLPARSLWPPPRGGYPLIVLVHTCCSGDKRNFEAKTVDASGELWHYNNAWFAARGYVVLTYTSRGFVNGSGDGSTGQMQLDSRRYEVNDFQDLACQVAAQPAFHVNPSRVVVSGSSYGGGLSWLALTDPAWGCATAGHPKLRMRLAAAAPKYGWSDLAYSLIPNGTHTRDGLPPTDPAHPSDLNPFGFPRRSVVGALYATGVTGIPPAFDHTTFPSSIGGAAACLQSTDPYETNPLCTGLFSSVLGQVLRDSSPYYQNGFFTRLRRHRIRPVPLFSTGSLTSPLFSQVEHRDLVTRLRSAVRRYPVQEYYGDVGDFTQGKAKEWGDLCGADRHVCRLSDYPGGNLGSRPRQLRRAGITTRLNRFIDRFARPPGDRHAPVPRDDVTVALKSCSAAPSPGFPADEPGQRFTALRFGQLAPRTLRLHAGGTQVTMSTATPNPHAASSDPIAGAPSGNPCPVESSSAGPGVATYDFAPLGRSVTTIGRSRVRVPYAGTAGAGLELNARLYEVLADGSAVMIDRGGIRLVKQSGTAVFDLNGGAWRFRKGDRVRIELAQDDDPYVSRSSRASSLTLSGVTLSLPVR